MTPEVCPMHELCMNQFKDDNKAIKDEVKEFKQQTSANCKDCSTAINLKISQIEKENSELKFINVELKSALNAYNDRFTSIENQLKDIMTELKTINKEIIKNETIRKMQEKQELNPKENDSDAEEIIERNNNFFLKIFNSQSRSSTVFIFALIGLILFLLGAGLDDIAKFLGVFFGVPTTK
jgi:septation ring formation regulator EzrA